ncbi:hypothetical protein KA005_83160 [bacterium]|nr:hypothetical protein [bacterium]
MKAIKIILWSFGIIITLIVTGWLATVIGKSIFNARLNNPINDLSSPLASDRAHAAIKLKKLGESAAPAIPSLINILDDDTTLVWTVEARETESYTSPAEKAQEALAEIGKPAIEPLIIAMKGKSYEVRNRIIWALSKITGQDFGEDQVKWQKWWEENKETFLKKK